MSDFQKIKASVVTQSIIKHKEKARSFRFGLLKMSLVDDGLLGFLVEQVDLGVDKCNLDGLACLGLGSRSNTCGD